MFEIKNVSEAGHDNFMLAAMHDAMFMHNLELEWFFLCLLFIFCV
jgi:hypothetical protein